VRAPWRPREREEALIPIVGGLVIHREQITFDYVDAGTGELRRGQIAPADREHLAAWLAGRFTGQDAHVAVEGCTGWRYVAEELAAAGAVRMSPSRPVPRRCGAASGTLRQDRFPAPAGAAGRRAAARVLGPAVAHRGMPALLETYRDLRTEHTAWVQRIHAVLFHQGARQLGEQRLRTGEGLAALRAAAAQLSPAGQLQVTVALDMLQVLECHLDGLRRRLTGAARRLAGARELHARLYGVGPVTALALCCWLAGAGRFSSARKAVRFAGLDVTVWSSDRKGPPGRLSRHGEVVRLGREVGESTVRRILRSRGCRPAPRGLDTSCRDSCARRDRSGRLPRVRPRAASIWWNPVFWVGVHGGSHRGESQP